MATCQEYQPIHTWDCPLDSSLWAGGPHSCSDHCPGLRALWLPLLRAASGWFTASSQPFIRLKDLYSERGASGRAGASAKLQASAPPPPPASQPWTEALPLHRTQVLLLVPPPHCSFIPHIRHVPTLCHSEFSCLLAVARAVHLGTRFTFSPSEMALGWIVSPQVVSSLGGSVEGAPMARCQHRLGIYFVLGTAACDL